MMAECGLSRDPGNLPEALVTQAWTPQDRLFSSFISRRHARMHLCQAMELRHGGQPWGAHLARWMNWVAFSAYF